MAYDKNDVRWQAVEHDPLGVFAAPQYNNIDVLGQAMAHDPMGILDPDDKQPMQLPAYNNFDVLAQAQKHDPLHVLDEGDPGRQAVDADTGLARADCMQMWGN